MLLQCGHHEQDPCSCFNQDDSQKELSMSVRQDDDRRSWRVLQAALVLILCKDERRMPTKLRRRMLRWMQHSPENLVHLFELARVDQALDRQKLLNRSAQLAASKPVSRNISLLPRRAVFVGGAAAVALSLGLSIATIRDGGPPIRHVTLADGSVMHVLRGADVEVEFSEEVRLIKLPRGEAVFDVAKDPHRPFVVRSKWSDSMAVGTRFGVVTDSAATKTIVSEGEVRVVTRSGADATIGRLVRAGEEFQVIAGASQPQRVVPVDAERKISWSAGWLQFKGESVDEALRTFNRFSDVRIEVTQPELSNERMFFYRFEIDNPESFAVAIGAWLKVPVDRHSKRQVIYIGNRPRAHG